MLQLPSHTRGEQPSIRFGSHPPPQPRELPQAAHQPQEPPEADAALSRR
jgi:hypothetical protein